VTIHLKENPMSNVAGAQAQAKKPAYKGLDVEDIRDDLQDLGSSVGDMATRQYELAQDTVSEALRETSGAIQRNPLAAIAVSLSLGFLFGLVSGGRSQPASRRS
jgi:ElaB/YqjD/DUF883 family membrane-anchored ribosome-binding protein